VFFNKRRKKAEKENTTEGFYKINEFLQECKREGGGGGGGAGGLVNPHLEGPPPFKAHSHFEALALRGDSQPHNRRKHKLPKRQGKQH